MKYLIHVLIVAVSLCTASANWGTTGQAPSFKILETIDNDVELKEVSSDRYLFSPIGVQKLSDVSGWEIAQVSYKLSCYLNGNNNGSRKFPYSGFQTFSYGVTKPDYSLDVNATVTLDSTVGGGIKLFIGEPDAQVLPSFRPNDESVKLVQNVVGTLASIRIGGYPSIPDQIAARDLLLKKLGDRAKDYYTYGHLMAIFDPVWKFWDRRNEIWLEKRAVGNPSGDLEL